MSPTPVTFATPNQPSAYTWEATNEEVAARYGVPVEDIVRFDLNTAPLPPDLAQRVMDAGRFHASLSEYPPADYRRLVEAAAARYGVGTDELVVGAGADEILDVIAKTFLVEGSHAVIPVPTYAMFRVITEQRGAVAVARPATRPRRGLRTRHPGRARGGTRRRAALALLTEQPDRAARAGRRDRDAARPDRGRRGRPTAEPCRSSSSTRHMPSSSVGSLADLRFAHPNLIVIRTASKAYALAGLRVGFAIARPELVARMNPIRPPGSVSTVSVTVVTEALLDDDLAAANVARVAANGSGSSRRYPTRAGRWAVDHELRAGRLGFGRSRRRSCRGPAPTWPRAPHVPRDAPARRSPPTDGAQPGAERPSDRGSPGARNGVVALRTEARIQGYRRRRPISRRRLPMRTSSHSPPTSSGTSAPSATRVPFTVTPPPAIKRRASPRDATTPASARSTAMPPAMTSEREHEPAGRLEERPEHRGSEIDSPEKSAALSGSACAASGFAVCSRRDVTRKCALGGAGLGTRRKLGLEALDALAVELGEPAQVRADVPVVRVEPVLVERERRRPLRVEPDRVARVALAELGARWREQELVGQPVSRLLRGVLPYPARPPDQLEPGGDVAPLVGAAHLQLDAHRPVQVPEVVRLEEHVAELGERQPAVEAHLDRVLR